MLGRRERLATERKGVRFMTNEEAIKILTSLHDDGEKICYKKGTLENKIICELNEALKKGINALEIVNAVEKTLDRSNI